VMASGLCDVVTRSQVSKPAPVSSTSEFESELPTSTSDSAAQESAPVTDVSDHIQQRCSAADADADKDPVSVSHWSVH